MVLCDVHAHALPEMDDGSSSMEETLEMLKSAAGTGVGRIFLTPHFYGIHHPEVFYEAREARLGCLREVNTTGVEVKGGAEVAYFPGISNMEPELLRKLCLGNSHYLLLEMEFGTWDPMVFTDLRNLIQERNITPVMAHLERFLPFLSGKMLKELLAMPVRVQVNAEVMIDEKIRKRIFRKIPIYRIDFLGSDMHNMRTRKPNLSEGYRALSDAGYGEDVRRMTENANRIFDEA